MTYEEDVDERIRKKLNELFGVNGDNNVKFKGKGSICSTCKHFGGNVCAKKRPFAGFATKLSDCNEWEVCN